MQLLWKKIITSEPYSYGLGEPRDWPSLSCTDYTPGGRKEICHLVLQSVELPKHIDVSVWFLLLTHGFSWLLMVSGCLNNHCNKCEKRPLGGIGCHKCYKGNVHCRTITVKVCEKLNKNCHQGALVMEVLQNTNINWRTINGNIVLKFQLDSACCLWTIAAWNKITKKVTRGRWVKLW